MSFLPLQRSLLVTCPAETEASAERLPWGSCASFATSTAGVHLPAGVPRTAYVPSSAFLTLSTVCSSGYLAGLFHPAAASEIHSPGIFPNTQPTWLIANPCPLDVFTARLQPANRLRQLPALALRALIHVLVRCHRQAV